MSIFYVQEFGNSKGMIVELIHQTEKDVILRCVKDNFKFAVSKSNFRKFYSDFDTNDVFAFNPLDDELDKLDIVGLDKVK